MRQQWGAEVFNCRIEKKRGRLLDVDRIARGWPLYLFRGLVVTEAFRAPSVGFHLVLVLERAQCCTALCISEGEVRK